MDNEIIYLDNAATTRLDTAKAQARLLISNLPETARGTVITAGETTQVLVSSSQDQRLLYQALESLQTQPGGSDLTAALELASATADSTTTRRTALATMSSATVFTRCAMGVRS